jgi:hypothetical protein
MLDDVTGRADADPVKHMRLAAIQRSVPLHGCGADAHLEGTGRYQPLGRRLHCSTPGQPPATARA